MIQECSMVPGLVNIFSAKLSFFIIFSYRLRGPLVNFCDFFDVVRGETSFHAVMIVDVFLCDHFRVGVPCDSQYTFTIF